jgi:hypothetical protein
MYHRMPCTPPRTVRGCLYAKNSKRPACWLGLGCPASVVEPDPPQSGTRECWRCCRHRRNTSTDAELAKAACAIAWCRCRRRYQCPINRNFSGVYFVDIDYLANYHTKIIKCLGRADHNLSDLHIRRNKINS